MSETGKTIALMVGVLLVLAITVACATGAKADTPTPAKGTDVAKKVQTKCPIMGNPIDKSLFVDKDGKRIYVCCKMCPDKVKKDFDTYAKKLEAQGIDLTIPKDAAKAEAKPGTAKSETNAQTAPADGKIVYTCPMHPEVTSDKQGQCPKCGMNLVPKKPAGAKASQKSAAPMSCCQ